MPLEYNHISSKRHRSIKSISSKRHGTFTVGLWIHIVIYSDEVIYNIQQFTVCGLYNPVILLRSKHSICGVKDSLFIFQYGNMCITNSRFITMTSHEHQTHQTTSHYCLCKSLFRLTIMEISKLHIPEIHESNPSSQKTDKVEGVSMAWRLHASKPVSFSVRLPVVSLISYPHFMLWNWVL